MRIPIGRGGRAVRLRGGAILLLTVMTALLISFTYPLRTYLAERSRIEQLERRTEQLERANEELRRGIRRLHDPAYIERLARECLGMARPGEIAFVVVPAPPSKGLDSC